MASLNMTDHKIYMTWGLGCRESLGTSLTGNVFSKNNYVLYLWKCDSSWTELHYSNPLVSTCDGRKLPQTINHLEVFKELFYNWYRTSQAANGEEKSSRLFNRMSFLSDVAEELAGLSLSSDEDLSTHTSDFEGDRNLNVQTSYVMMITFNVNEHTMYCDAILIWIVLLV